MGKLRIIVSGKIAMTSVGHIDHALSYASGLARLGHEVWLMDRAGSGRCVDAAGARVPFDAWQGRSHFEAVAREYGLWPRSCLIYRDGRQSHGMDYADAVRVARDCDLLITRSGRIDKVAEIFGAAGNRAYFDGNPGSTQVQYVQGQGEFEVLDRYKHLFTLGLRIGTPGCPVPVSDRHWHRLPRPVPLPSWPVSTAGNDGAFTTVSTWKGRTSVEWQGRGAGEKSDNWRDYLALPVDTRQPFEIAMQLDAPEHLGDRARFERHGWRLSDPRRLRCREDYRRFIASSRAEFSVAHNRYVDLATGWFSDRSALYLASGKPVLVQSTGIEEHLPTGRGLLTFRNMDEAMAGVEAINSDYASHCRAAREIAEAHFDADKVLARVLQLTGL